MNLNGKYWKENKHRILLKKQAKRMGHCERCGYKYNLTISHKDHNKENNSADNLEVLCSLKETFLLFGYFVREGCHTKYERDTVGSKATIRTCGLTRNVIQGTARPLSKLEQWWFKRGN